MKALLLSSLLLISSNVFAVNQGQDKGNGGGIHYCTSETVQEFYDIYEAQARYGYKIIDRKLSLEDYIQYALNRITKTNSYIGKKVKEQLDYLNDNHMIIRNKARLTPVEDANILVTDEGCTYKQLANWDEISGNIIVKKEYYDSMSNLNKAAFHIHETLYKVGRDLDLLEKSTNGRTTSDEIRRIVGQIFSSREAISNLWTYNLDEIEAARKIAEEKAQEEERVRNENRIAFNAEYNFNLNALNKMRNNPEVACKPELYAAYRTFENTLITYINFFDSLADNPFLRSEDRIEIAYKLTSFKTQHSQLKEEKYNLISKCNSK